MALVSFNLRIPQNGAKWCEPEESWVLRSFWWFFTTDQDHFIRSLENVALWKIILMGVVDGHMETGKLQKVQELHSELRQWQSGFQLMYDEIAFIERLLGSYAFQPNTPNLFERLTNYLDRLRETKKGAFQIMRALQKYECYLGGVMECTKGECDQDCYRKHLELKKQAKNCLRDFGGLKAQIFNYAGGILKRRKPD